MTPTKEQIEVERVIANGIVMRLLDLRSPGYLSGYGDYVMNVATAFATARLEARNKALEDAARAMNPMLRSMISRGEAHATILALKDPNRAALKGGEA